MPALLHRRFFVGGLLFAAALTAQAAWPERPVRIVVPSAAGGSPDIVSRLVANELAKRLRQPVVVDNRPGAAGNIGMQAVMTAAPDGYTIGYGNNATLSTNEFLFARLPYDPARLEPIVGLVNSSSLLVVHNAVPARSVQELVAYAKQQPAGLAFGSSGTGTSSHLGAELLKSVANMPAQHVPYKGAPQAINDLMGGSVQFLIDNIASVGPSVSAGKLRALAVTSRQRSPLFPDLPTLDEAGFAGLEITAWGGLVAPPGTPAAVVDRLNREVNEILRDETVRAQLARLAFTPIGGTTAQFRALATEERRKWGEVVRKSGAKVD